MLNDNLNESFITHDLALASILRSNGLTYTIDRQEERRVFIFPDKKRAQEIAGEYYSHREALKGEMFND